MWYEGTGIKCDGCSLILHFKCSAAVPQHTKTFPSCSGLAHGCLFCTATKNVSLPYFLLSFCRAEWNQFLFCNIVKGKIDSSWWMTFCVNTVAHFVGCSCVWNLHNSSIQMFLLVFIVSSLVTCIVELLNIFTCSCCRGWNLLNANKSGG